MRVVRRGRGHVDRAAAVFVNPAAGVWAHGNGFIAAFVAGTAFSAAARWLPREPTALTLTEGMGR